MQRDEQMISDDFTESEQKLADAQRVLRAKFSSCRTFVNSAKKDRRISPDGSGGITAHYPNGASSRPKITRL